MSIYYFRTRKVRCCYFNLTAKLVNKALLELERQLELLAEKLQIEAISSLDDPRFFPCDLLIVAASGLSTKQVLQWLKAYRQKSLRQEKIDIPVLLISKAVEEESQTFFAEALKTNWFFDVCSDQHQSSLPIRAANLIRVHDLLHDLRRRDEALQAMKS